MCYRGQKVVCVTDYRLPHCPFKNGVYTVSEVLENPDLTGRPVWCSGVPMSAGWLDPAYGNTWLRLAEIPQQPHYVRAIAFRPLRPTSIEVFRELLEPAHERA